MTTPKIRSVFLERANTNTHAFQAWFRNSKVVNEDGTPAVMYHVTNSKIDFDVFRYSRDLGSHFGTAKAAQDRSKFLAGSVDNGDNPQRTYNVYLSIQRPIELPDLKSWEVGQIADELVKKNIISQFNADQVKTMDRERGFTKLLELLKRSGYDGVKYKNKVEDAGSYSWITFDPGQVKSVNNKGTWDRRRASIME